MYFCIDKKSKIVFGFGKNENEAIEMASKFSDNRNWKVEYFDTTRQNWDEYDPNIHELEIDIVYRKISFYEYFGLHK